jgi:hypothetical protein
LFCYLIKKLHLFNFNLNLAKVNMKRNREKDWRLKKKPVG